MMSRMCFVLLMQVAVVVCTQEVPSVPESCSAGDTDCSSDSNVLIQKKVTTHSAGDGDWSVNAAEFPDNMNVETMVYVCDYDVAKPDACKNDQPQEKGTLAAFLKDDVRGREDTPISPPFGPQKGKPEFPMTIHGKGSDSGDVVFKFKSEDHCVTELTGDQDVPFKINTKQGNAIHPMILKGGWNFDHRKYEESMTMFVVVEIDGKEEHKGVLAAFINGEVRGVSLKPIPPPFGPNKGAPFYSLMVHADGKEDGDKVTYKYRACDGTVTELNHDAAYDFKTNAHHGNIVTNKIVFTGSAGGGDDSAEISAPTCQDDNEGMKKAAWGYSCDQLKGWCIGFAKLMKQHCKATCKDVFKDIVCG